MTEFDSFFQGLILSADIIGQMGLLVLLGYIMVRKQWISSQTLTDLTRVLIDCVIPSAFVLSMVRSFSMNLIRESLVLVLVVCGWIISSWIIGSAWFRFMPGSKPAQDRAVTAMLMISNSIYLPLPVILAVTPTAMRDQATVYISIAAIPSIAFMWTICVLLLSGNTAKLTGKEQRKLIFNAPLISVVIGIILTFIPGMTEAARAEPGSLIPLKMIFSVMNYLSQILSPLAMIILGGFIASSKMTERFKLRHVLPLITIRLILTPAIVFFLIKSGILQLHPLAATVLLLVAAAPPATNHSLIARKYNGEWEIVSSLQLLVHAVALVTVPIWLALGLNL